MPDFERLINAIDVAEEHSYGHDGDGTLADERTTAINVYLGKNILPAPEGRSQVNDRSAYETVQWMKPSLARIFASGDDVVELEPVGPEDEEGAKQESQYLNHIILRKNNWFQVFDTGQTDALTVKAGYLYTYPEKIRQVEREKYTKQTAESLALIMQDQPEMLSMEEYSDPDYQTPPPQPAVDPMTGQPMLDPMGQPVMMPPPPPPMLYDVEIRRTKVETKHCVEALPPERCKVSMQTKTVQVSRFCPYFEYFDFPTISELRQKGYEVPDDIESDDVEGMEEYARDQFGETRWNDTNPIDPAMRRVKCRWIWISYDYDEDGISELQYVVRVGTTILHREECNRIPIAVLCPDPLPHRHVGLCPVDTVAELQQIKTVILRNGLDNLQLSQNPRTFVANGMINLDDLRVSRPGGIVRGKVGAVFGQHIMPFETPFVFDKAMLGLQYMDQVKQQRTGVSEHFTGIDENSLNHTATGVQQLSTMAAQRVEQIARNFANGIEELFSILHENILKGGHKKDVVKLRGKWVTVDPASWRSRTDFRICVGYAAGNKDAQIARLMQLGMMQKEAMAGGLSIVTERNVYETAIELTKASDFSNPDRFWTDPANAQPKGPPQPDVTVVTAEQIRAKAQVEAKRMDVEQKERDSQRDYDVKLKEMQLGIATAELDLNKHRESLQHEEKVTEFGARKDEHIARVNAELNPKNIEAKTKASESKATTDVLKALQESQSEQTQIIIQALEGLAKALSAPRVIDRGKDGRAIGSRVQM